MHLVDLKSAMNELTWILTIRRSTDTLCLAKSLNLRVKLSHFSGVVTSTSLPFTMEISEPSLSPVSSPPKITPRKKVNGVHLIPNFESLLFQSRAFCWHSDLVGPMYTIWSIERLYKGDLTLKDVVSVNFPISRAIAMSKHVVLPEAVGALKTIFWSEP